MLEELLLTFFFLTKKWKILASQNPLLHPMIALKDPKWCQSHNGRCWSITAEIAYFLHGTTVATNAVLEGKGAKVGLVTTEGYRDVMQIARSFVPGGLAAWIVWPKPQPLAHLEDTIEVPGRMDADGNEVRPLDESATRGPPKT